MKDVVGASGVTVIMAASQAVDPGSTPGWRRGKKFFLFRIFVYLPYLLILRRFFTSYREALGV